MLRPQRSYVVVILGAACVLGGCMQPLNVPITSERPPASSDEAGSLRLACIGNDMNACSRLGYDYSIGSGVPVNGSRAAELFERACDGGDAYGCEALGLCYVRGEGVPRDEAHALDRLLQACDLAGGTRCTSAALLLIEGNDVATDGARAAPLLERACALHDVTACTALGVLYGEGVGVARDFGRAATLFDRACDEGNVTACNDLALLELEGSGVALDEPRGVALLARACDADGREGCATLSMLYAVGIAVPVDTERARVLAARACDAGDGDGCVVLARLAWMAGDADAPSRVVASLERACTPDETAGCADLGYAYAIGFGVPRDEAQARRLFARAYPEQFWHCPGGRFADASAGRAPSAATVAAWYVEGYQGAPVPRCAEERFDGDESGSPCAADGALCSTRRVHAARDVRRADERVRDLDILARACEPDAVACFDIGTVYEAAGSDANRQRARSLYARARTFEWAQVGLFRLGGAFSAAHAH